MAKEVIPAAHEPLVLERSSKELLLLLFETGEHCRLSGTGQGLRGVRREIQDSLEEWQCYALGEGRYWILP